MIELAKKLARTLQDVKEQTSGIPPTVITFLPSQVRIDPSAGRIPCELGLTPAEVIEFRNRLEVNLRGWLSKCD